VAVLIRGRSAGRDHARRDQRDGSAFGLLLRHKPSIYVEPDLLANSTDAIVDSGTRLVRYPGGSPANKYLWDCDTDTWPYFAQWSSMCGANDLSLAHFVEAVAATGSTPFVQLNAALALVYGAEAAAAYFIAGHEALLGLGINVTYYEFGNENYDGWVGQMKSARRTGFRGGTLVFGRSRLGGWK
jgi:hypothetical protein